MERLSSVARASVLVVAAVAAAGCGNGTPNGAPGGPGGASSENGDSGWMGADATSSLGPSADASQGLDAAQSADRWQGNDSAQGADAPDRGDASEDVGSSSDARAASDSAADAGVGPGPEQCVHRAPVASKWKLVWSDEFDKDGAPDPSNWGFEHGFVRNQELQWYQPDNATVAGGLLTIAARREQVTNPNYKAGSTDWKTSRQVAQYTSTSMTTSGKRSFEYGRFEMCGRIDTRQGSWPAFWILGNGRSWPASGEVDIMEYYASNVRANVCKPSGSTCDWSGSVAQPLSKLGASWSSAFHLWAMEWSATDIVLSLDDVLVYDFKVASATASPNPYTGNAFYILVNLAIGANGGDPSATQFPITYDVDYVRVYQ